MAQFQKPTEFLNQNLRIAQTKLHNPNNVFQGKSMTIITFYHIDSKESTVDKGLQSVENYLDGSLKYKKIMDVPVYGIDMMDLQYEETEEIGGDINVEGNFTIPAHIVHPFQYDFFTIDNLSQPMLFQITEVNYDTPTKQEFFRCAYKLYSNDDESLRKLQDKVRDDYRCIFDNIGTVNKSVVLDVDFDVLNRIREIQFRLRKEYFEKFYDKAYNALMYQNLSNSQYLYDPILNEFCNREKVFEMDVYNTADCFLLYTEHRMFHGSQYEDSIFDRISHNDLTDLDEIGKYYDIEITRNDVSAFDYMKDMRVKYLLTYANEIGPFGNRLKEYIPSNFIAALELRNSANLTDDFEKFVFMFMANETVNESKKSLDLVDKRRLKYSVHTYVFIPLIMYCLRQVYNSIVLDVSVMDANVIEQYSINTKGGKL